MFPLPHDSHGFLYYAQEKAVRQYNIYGGRRLWGCSCTHYLIRRAMARGWRKRGSVAPHRLPHWTGADSALPTPNLPHVRRTLWTRNSSQLKTCRVCSPSETHVFFYNVS